MTDMTQTIVTSILADVRQLIEQSKQRAAVAVNAELTRLYWQIGQRIRQDILHEQRAKYGKSIVANLSKQLSADYGRGWSVTHLWYCINFFDIFPDKKILHTLCGELSWSHLRLLLAVDAELKRNFYVELCRLEKWSVRQLQERMKSMLYERTTISRQPDETIRHDLQALREQGRLSADLAFRDPYVLDFLGLADTYSEKDLESAIVAELQSVIMELGSDFALVARQKSITIKVSDYYIDLLFYHRRLRCLVAIELKIGEFEAAYKGQMELYLRYLEKYEQLDGENTPIGLILCTGKNHEHVELLQLDKSNIRVADYLTLLPPKEVLEEKLHRSIERARQRMMLNGSNDDA